MKTILFKIWKFPQLSETFIINQIIIAIKLGYDVKILVGELNEIEGNANNDLFEKYNLLDKIIIEDYSIHENKILRYLRALFLLILNLTNLKFLLKYYNVSAQKGMLPLFEFNYYKKFRNVHAIHIQFGTNKHPVDKLKLIGFLNSKLIVSFHGHDLHFPINGSILSEGYYENLFKASEYLICNTIFLENRLLSLSGPSYKVKVIPVAVDTQIFFPNLYKQKSKKIRLITIGRLDELKGQIHGIHVVKALLDKGYTIEYIIIGDGIAKKSLKKEISFLKLDEHIKLLGALTPQEVLLQYLRSDIFLMTSITNSLGMAESQGLVTAEAQACGLPVVAFDSGGVKYTLQDNITGFLCTEQDLECYTKKLEALLDNPQLRNEMGENARKFIEAEYSENSVLNKWRGIYD